MYVVIIEWDGKKPPNAFYRRIHALATRGVRGDKSIPTLERRISENRPGIIIQEGAIVVPSESLSRLIALLAREYGASYVQVGQVRLEKTLAPSPEDEKAMDMVESIIGRRGRRPKVKNVWTVVCHECMGIHRILTSTPLNCPTCGGVKIGARLGEPPRFRDPGTHILNSWLRTRFSRGTWEPGLLDGNDCPPEDVYLKDPQERATVELFKRAQSFLKDVEILDRQVAFQVLDAVFVARTYWSKKRRQEFRIDGVMVYLRTGGDPSLVVLAEGETPDILDATGPIGAETVAGLLRYLSTVKDKENPDANTP